MRSETIYKINSNKTSFHIPYTDSVIIKINFKKIAVSVSIYSTLAK